MELALNFQYEIIGCSDGLSFRRLSFFFTFDCPILDSSMPNPIRKLSGHSSAWSSVETNLSKIPCEYSP